jgi:hypothetical protein
MPKTRNNQFVIAFNDFISDVTKRHYPLLFEYKLECITPNKSYKHHTYNLRIPKKILAYRIESNDEIIINENVYTEQELPDSEEFKNHFFTYFDKYKLVIDNRKMSYMDIFDHDIYGDDSEDYSVDDLNFVIFIYYYKSHIPFPVALTKMEELIKRNKELETTNKDLESCLDNYIEQLEDQFRNNNILRRRMRRERREMHDKYLLLFEKMQQKFREYYDSSDKKEDCPVCYETMDSSKLIVPTCTHFICNSCSDRCDKCPLCRETYV